VEDQAELFKAGSPEERRAGTPAIVLNSLPVAAGGETFRFGGSRLILLAL